MDDTFKTCVHVLLGSSRYTHEPLLGVLDGRMAHHVWPWNQTFDWTVVVVSSPVGSVGRSVHVSAANTTFEPDHMNGPSTN